MIFDLPYLMPDYDAVNILLDGKVGKELSRSLEKIGIKAWAGSPSAPVSTG